MKWDFGLISLNLKFIRSDYSDEWELLIICWRIIKSDQLIKARTQGIRRTMEMKSWEFKIIVRLREMKRDEWLMSMIWEDNWRS